jgi:hypothetical protein
VLLELHRDRVPRCPAAGQLRACQVRFCGDPGSGARAGHFGSGAADTGNAAPWWHVKHVTDCLPSGNGR